MTVVPRVPTRWPLRAWLSRCRRELLAAGALISPSSLPLAVLGCRSCRRRR